MAISSSAMNVRSSFGLSDERASLAQPCLRREAMAGSSLLLPPPPARSTRGGSGSKPQPPPPGMADMEALLIHAMRSMVETCTALDRFRSGQARAGTGRLCWLPYGWCAAPALRQDGGPCGPLPSRPVPATEPSSRGGASSMDGFDATPQASPPRHGRAIPTRAAFVAALGYTRQGPGTETIRAFRRMRWGHVQPTGHTLDATPKACATLSDLETGRQAHAFVAGSGLGSGVIVGADLVGMYTKCSSVKLAHQVFDRMPWRSIMPWNTIISGCVRRGDCEEAVALFEQMGTEGIKPSGITFVSVLKACSILSDLERGKRVHALTAEGCYQSNSSVGNTLVAMYAKCGSVRNAYRVFSEMHEQDVASWNAMIDGYARQGLQKEALALFLTMKRENVNPDNITFVNLLKACTGFGARGIGKLVHACVIESGLQSDAFVSNKLVDIYVKCGSLKDAQQVFHKICKPNVVSWTALITGYVQHGFREEASVMLVRMQLDGLKPDRIMFVTLLKACASSHDIEMGKQVHFQITRSGFELDAPLGSALIDMYAQCGCMEDACKIFHKMPERGVVIWTAMITGCVRQALGKKALSLFSQMEHEGVRPNNFTFVGVLKACTSLVALEQGKQVHIKIVKSGFECDAFVQCALIDMYASCGALESAEQVFTAIHNQDVVVWNAMIKGYAEQGLCKQAIMLFKQMQYKCLKPTVVTFISILKACTCRENLDWGKYIHGLIIESGLELEVNVSNSVIDMYWKCGSIKDAFDLFTKTPHRDAVSWNIMIGGCAQQGHNKEALLLFEQMESDFVKPDEVTFSIVLKACGSLSALGSVRRMHSRIIQSGFDSNVFVGSSLIDAYMKCGCIDDARQAFEGMQERNTVTWNTMLCGYAQQGLGKEALILLDQMWQDGMEPNETTYVCALFACSHAGLVDEGYSIFNFISQEQGVTLMMEHYACMVDVLARAGLLDDAHEFVRNMPIQPNSVVFRALLGVCRNFHTVELGNGCNTLTWCTSISPAAGARAVELSSPSLMRS